MANMDEHRDFYEDDESPEDIRAIFEAGPQGTTGQGPRLGWNESLPPFATPTPPSTYFGGNVNSAAQAS